MARSSEPKPAGKGGTIRGRLGGLAMLAVGLFFLYDERGTIARTGHAGRKSAGVPLIICAGLAFLIDPDARRPGIMAALYLLGAAAGVAWFIFLQ